MNYEEKKEIHEFAKRIIDSDLEWKEKYDIIFSEEVSRKFSLNYYDTDTSYEEDVMAFMDALDDHMRNQEIISEQKDLRDKPVVKRTFSYDEVQKIAFDVMNLGMTLRQNQLNGSINKSGNEVLKDYMDSL